MAESDEETRSPTQKLMRGVTPSGRESPMDLDVDLDVSWLLDQIPFISNPMSPLLLSSSSSFDLPSSPPLRGFPDGKDGNNNAFTAGPALAGCTQFIISDNPDTANEKQTNGDKRSAVPSLFGLRPLENPDGSCLIKERMMLALRYFKDSSEQHILAQVWAPIKSGGRYVLTTSGQPFVLDTHSNGLHQYRMVSLTYMFSADGGESNGELGLPGRVFQQKLPEWTPNVQYYSSKEYPRLNHALNHNVQGTLALPVFETSGQSCIGVLELIMTKPKINYAPDVDKVCKALEAVNLKSSEILDRSSTQICNEGRRNALAEILEILIVACETHKLPLAQTWVPCRHRSVLVDGGGLKKNCTSFDGSCMGQVCMSTIDTAVYIIDAHIWGFREACSEHHLQKGQGVAGRAFSSHNLCFCSDITQFSKKEYPLAHYARLFGLTGCLAICLRSSHTGNDEYVLEFFLPPNIRDSREQETLLESLLATMRQHFHSLEVVKPVKESGGEISIEVIKSSTGEELHSALEFITMPRASESPNGSDALPRGGDMLMKIHPLANESMVEVNALDDGGNVASVCGSHQAVSVSEKKDTKKTLERKRGKAEKSISLEVLQNYFAGSLKEAAKSLGVCPTTMKRICRQHGISRWPSRKIKKVNRSLSKLKHVIESVQGAQGAISLNAFASNPLPATVGSFSWPASIAGSNQPNSRSSKPSELDGGDTEMHTCKTPGNEEQDVTLGYEELIHENRSKTKSATKEESSGTPTSHGSCHSSPANITAPVNDLFVASPGRNHVESGGALRFLFQEQLDMNSLADSSIYYEEPFGGMLTGDAGSSKDLRNASDTLFDERLSPHMAPEEPVDALAISGSPITTRQDLKDTTIKATYREDIIRFRFSLTSGIVALQEEVAKRLKLEVGTFEIKYLDDDCELVLIACDADLDECMDISRSSGRNIVRLSVHDITANLGSSCESSWD